MEVLWRIGSGTTRDVLGALPDADARAYSTIRTTLRILEDKGYLSHRTDGRAFVYYPVVERAQARRRAVRHLIGRFFDGSPEQLVLNVLAEEELDGDDVERIKRLIDVPAEQR